jgi:hypothetical protein
MQDVRSLFQSAITIRRNEGIAPAGIVLDLAEALDAMGATNDGIDLLSSLNDSLSADLDAIEVSCKTRQIHRSQELGARLPAAIPREP